MTIVSAIWFLGQPAGVFLGPLIFNIGGYISVFGTSLVLYVVCLFYTIIVMRNEFIENSGSSSVTEPKLFSKDNIR